MTPRVNRKVNSHNEGTNNARTNEGGWTLIRTGMFVLTSHLLASHLFGNLWNLNDVDAALMTSVAAVVGGDCGGWRWLWRLVVAVVIGGGCGGWRWLLGGLEVYVAVRGG